MAATDINPLVTSQTSLIIDLTDSEPNQVHQATDISFPSQNYQNMPRLPTDHMHSVVNIIRKQSSLSPPIEVSGDVKAEGVECSSHFRKRSTIVPQQRVRYAETLKNIQKSTRKRQMRLRTGSAFKIPLSVDNHAIPESSNASQSTYPSYTDIHSPKKKGGAPSAFRFLSLPPEIRNSVYRLLLTTPTSPIELPRLANKIAKRSAEWQKCKSARRKARFKSIFLEVLQTCKQIHDEASGILYGCNVFKFRSCYSEGAKKVILPTRHLHLLKHIKVSVISLDESLGQDRWVADLLKSFTHEDMRLETFELVWYGWGRLHLHKGGPLSLALQMLHVDRQFVVKVTGAARMEKDMALELKQNVRGARVEIHRPVKISSDGVTVELSDDEEFRATR